MYRKDFWTLWERARVGQFGRMALKMYNIIRQMNRQIRCIIQDAPGWCTGMTQKDDMGRVVGGGFRVENSCTPMVDSCQCMAKPI